MADNIIKVGVEVSDNGTAGKTTKNVENLKDVVVQTETAAKRTSKALSAMSMQGPGGATVSRAQQAGTSAAASQAYGVARGAIGTGAEGRDFAKQSQGLGGLVRVYATFAANLFAATAAFQALSNAMDTSNMIKGLDQLGAQSGKNLGTLAKNLVNVTDGAISVREAMEAVAKTSAAGMSSQDILRLGKAAKTVSVALGVDMSDAVSRLSRGITKLEPELLDELGIFVRVDKAAADYALKLNKSALSLTDFEKRQAFANAVLTEAEKKFGSIDVDANPFSKLLATLKNVSQSTLEFVNIFLAPVVKLLSESPTALLAILTGIGAVLLKQAIPAITQFRENLRRAADESAARAADIKDTLVALKQLNQQQITFRLSESAKNLGKEVESALAGARETFNKGIRLGGEQVKDIISKQAQDLTEADLSKLRARQKMFATTATGKEPGSAAAEQYAERAQKVGAIADALEKARGKQAELNAEIERQAAAARKVGFTEGMINRIAESTERSAKKFQILANAVENVKIIGPLKSFQLLRAEIALSEIGFSSFQAKLLMVRGAIAITTATIGLMVAAFGNIVMGVAGVISILGLLSSWFGKNSAEAQAASSALDTITESAKNVDRTLLAINKKDFLGQLSAESLSARSTAFESLAASMVDGIQKVKEEIDNRNWMDKATNWLASWVGKDTETKMAASLTTALDRVVLAAGNTLDLEPLRKQLTELLKLEASASFAEIKKAYAAAPIDIKLEGAELFDKAGKSFKAAAQSALDFNQQMMATSKIYDEIGTKFQVSDMMAKFGEAQAKQAITLTGELSNTNNALAAMLGILGDVNKLRLFPPETAERLLKFKENVESLSEAQQQNKVILEAEKVALERVNAELKERISNYIIAQGSVRAPQALRDVQESGISATNLKQQIFEREQAAAGFGKAIKIYSQEFKTAASESFIEGSKRVGQSILESFSKAQGIIKSAILAIFPDTKTTINEQSKLAQQQFDLDITRLKSEQNLINSQERLRLAYEASERKKGVESKQISEPESKMLEAFETLQKAFMAGELSPKQALAQYDVLAKESAGLNSKAIMNSAQNALALINRQSGVSGQIQEKGAGKQAEEISRVSKLTQLDSKERVRLIDVEIDKITRAQELLNLSTPGLTQLEALVKQQELAQLKADEDFKKAAEPIATKIGEAVKLGQKDQVGEQLVLLRNLTNQKELTDEQRKLVNSILLGREKINEQLQKEKQAQDQLIALAGIANKSAEDDLAYEEQKLNYLQSIDAITADQLQQQRKAIELKRIDLSLEAEKLQATTAYLDKIRDINRQLSDPAGVSESKRIDLDQQKTNAAVLLTSSLTAAEKGADLRKKSIELMASQDDSTKKYADYFKSSVSSMADALVDFALTGKQSFGDMIKSMIAGLIKLEFQMQVMNAYQTAGGASGIFSSLGKLFGSGSGASSGGSFIDAGTAILSAFAANGAVYDSGVQTYAKGDAFTNTVVTKPTMFAFAKGAGLMGEAGPEAIMPLKRGANGSLGVQAGSAPTTTVVVNNYSSEKATTKESVDNRGNRKIEVVVGEMAAAEMQRPNSAVQNTMRNTFGVAPMLVRR